MCWKDSVFGANCRDGLSKWFHDGCVMNASSELIPHSPYNSVMGKRFLSSYCLDWFFPILLFLHLGPLSCPCRTAWSCVRWRRWVLRSTQKSISNPGIPSLMTLSMILSCQTGEFLLTIEGGFHRIRLSVTFISPVAIQLLGVPVSQCPCQTHVASTLFSCH